MKIDSIEDADKLFPLKTFFNQIRDDEFVSTIRDMVHGIGRGFDDLCCTFPGDLDPNEEAFQGAEFWIYRNDAVIVDNQTLMYYLRLASAEYTKRCPEDRAIIEQILAHSELV